HPSRARTAEPARRRRHRQHQQGQLMPRPHSAATAPRPTSRTHATPNGRFRLRSSRSGGACLLAVASWGTFARAELPSRVQPLDTTSDGVYGRMEGDVTFSARAHAELA